MARASCFTPVTENCHEENRLERETGIEPATNSLEGCDSTTELLPLRPADMPSVTLPQNGSQLPGGAHLGNGEGRSHQQSVLTLAVPAL